MRPALSGARDRPDGGPGLTGRLWPAALILALALAVFLGVRFRPGPAERVVTVRDTVVLEVLRAGAPQIRQTVVERVAWKTVPPETVLVTVAGADSSAARFCAPLAAADSGVGADTAAAQLALSEGHLRNGSLTLWGFTNTARAYRGVFPVQHRSPPITWVTDGDSVVVRQRREFRLLGLSLRDLVLVGAAGLGGYAVAQ